jgi:hypothetical protein
METKLKILRRRCLKSLTQRNLHKFFSMYISYLIIFYILRTNIRGISTIPKAKNLEV